MTIVIGGILLPEEVLQSEFFAVLAAFVAINTIMYVTLAIAKMLLSAGVTNILACDTKGAILHQPGNLTADVNIGQWWTNESDEEARWYVVDIYKTDGNAGE